MSQHDVIVIGSGIGGLTAALTCAKVGQRVLVLEAAKQFGGFINPFARKHYWFDTGIHYIGEMAEGQPLQRHFKRLGILDKVPFRELNPDGFDRYVFPDYEVRMCKGADAFRERLAQDFPSERAGLDKFFRLLNEVNAAIRTASKIKGPKSALKMAPFVPSMVRYGRATFSQILDDCTQEPRLRAALAGPSGDLGLPPGKVSGMMMMALLAHYLDGAYFPVGGSKAVRDAYVDLLKAHGAEMHRNTRVARILVEDGRAVGVRTAEGEEYFAKSIISNVDAAQTLREMVGPEHLPRSLHAKVGRTTQSLGSICAFIGTDLNPADFGVGDENIWHYTSTDIDALYQPALDGKMSDELPFFLTVPTLKDPDGDHAPAGKHTVELITFAPYEPFARWAHQKTLKRDQAYRDLKMRYGEALIARAEKYIPGLSSHMNVCEIASPLTNTSFVNVPQGAIYGPDHTPSQVALGRYRTDTPVQGLFLCGSSVVGCGIATCVASGALAGRMALKSGMTESPKRGKGVMGALSSALGRS